MAMIEKSVSNLMTSIEPSQAFDAVLEVRFRQCPGHRKIQDKEYALCAKATNKDIEKSTVFNCCFLPGRRVVMSMIFDGGYWPNSICPGCGSWTASSVDGEIQWYVLQDSLRKSFKAHRAQSKLPDVVSTSFLLV